MRFKNPGGNLVWMTPLFTLAGCFLAFMNVREGSIGFAVLYGSLGLFSALVWFDLKWVAIPLMIYFSLAIISGSVMLFVVGFSMMLLSKLVLAGYTVFELWEWRNRPDG